MNRRTRLLIGASILLLGAGTFWLASTQAQQDIRQVGDVLAAPREHATGRYTLVGVPEPQQVPVTTSQGVALEANAAWSNQTRSTVSWTRDGATFYSTRILRVAAQPDGTLQWSFRNETRRSPADATLAFPPVEGQWTMGRAGQAFPVEAFASGPTGHARIWAFYGKAPENPMQPKPSQFKGHLATAAPDGTPLPEGALIWMVEEYTAGCSSKFLPPEAQAKYNVTADA